MFKGRIRRLEERVEALEKHRPTQIVQVLFSSGGNYMDILSQIKRIG